MLKLALSHTRDNTADLGTFTEEIRKGKLHFLCSAMSGHTKHLSLINFF